MRLLNDHVIKIFILFPLFCGSLEAGWQPPVVIGPASSTQPDVAVDPQGNAVAVWVYNDGTNTRIQASSQILGENWSSPAFLSPAGQDASDPSVAVDPKGNAVAIWTEADGENAIIQAATLAFGKTKWKLADAPLSKSISLDWSGPQVKFDKNGTALVIWGNTSSNDSMFIQGARLPYGSRSWIPLSDYYQPTLLSSCSLDVDPDGNAVVVWMDSTQDDRFQIKAATLSRDSFTLTPAVVISDPQDLSRNLDPLVAVNASGDAVAIWQNEDTYYSLRAARYSCQTRQWTPTDFPGISAAFSNNIAMDPAGNAIVVSKPDNYYVKNTPVMTTTLPAGSISWTKPVALSNSMPYRSCVGFRLAMDPKGNALAVWTNPVLDLLQVSTKSLGSDWSSPVSLLSLSINSPDQTPNIAVGLSSKKTAVIVYPSFDISAPETVQAISATNVFDADSKKVKS